MNIGILLGVFTLAYCGFLYQAYAPQQAVKAALAQTASAVTSRDQAHYNLEPDSLEIRTAALAESAQTTAANTLPVTGDTTSANYEQYRAHGNSAHQNRIQLTARQVASQITGSRETIQTTNHRVAYINGSATRRVTSTVSNTTTAAVQAESDNTIVGYEFLPDGSSQQDVNTSSSGNPRVYTIKDYQQADISCKAGYGEAAGHNKLIRELKGC